MAARKKKSSKLYWLFLFLYGAILIAGSLYALKLVWEYAGEYEASRPANTIDAYIAELSKNLMDEGIAETISQMPHEVQSDEEVAEHVKELLSDGITYFRKAGSSADANIYSLRCNGSEFGTVTLTEDRSYEDKVKFGLLPWKVTGETFDFTRLYSSVEVVVPASYSVQLNGVVLGSEYIVEEGIRYDVLDRYYDQFPDLPTKVRYRFENVIGTLDPQILDENGNPTVIDPDSDDSQFIVPCSEEELARLTQFAEGFAPNYLKYTSGVTDPMYGYGLLKPYLYEGMNLDRRMLDAMDGLSWAHTSSINVTSAVLNSALYLGSGCYSCDITATATTYALGKGEVDTTSNMRVIVYDTGSSIKAITLELY